MKAKIIRTTDLDINNLEEIEIPANKYDALLKVKEVIGGYLELCTCHIQDEPYYVFCDDNGKVKGKPINYLATFIYDYNAEDTINGDVVLFDVDSLLDYNNLF